MDGEEKSPLTSFNFYEQTAINGRSTCRVKGAQKGDSIDNIAEKSITELTTDGNPSHT